MVMLRKVFKYVLLFVIKIIGFKAFDSGTGEFLGKAFVIPFRGRLHVFGLNKRVGVKFLPQKKLSYIKSEIGFYNKNKVLDKIK